MNRATPGRQTQTPFHTPAKQAPTQTQAPAKQQIRTPGGAGSGSVSGTPASARKPFSFTPPSAPRARATRPNHSLPLAPETVYRVVQSTRVVLSREPERGKKQKTAETTWNTEREDAADVSVRTEDAATDTDRGKTAVRDSDTDISTQSTVSGSEGGSVERSEARVTEREVESEGEGGYGSVGGLEREVQAVREMVELPLCAPHLFADMGEFSHSPFLVCLCQVCQVLGVVHL